MTDIYAHRISAHAVERFSERVRPLPADDVAAKEEMLCCLRAADQKHLKKINRKRKKRTLPGTNWKLERKRPVAPLPEWMAGLKPGDWMYDGRPLRLPRDQEAWDNLNWSKAWVDLGPSPAGNLGPYWHVPVYDDQDGMLGSVHRLYPKVLASKWFGLIRQALTEAVERATKQEAAPRAE